MEIDVREITLYHACNLFMDSRLRKYAHNTTRGNRTALNALIRTVGIDTKVIDITEEMMDHALSVEAARLTPSSYNNRMSTWSQFFDFCIRRGFRGDGRFVHPMGDKRRYLKVPPGNKIRVPAMKFQALLDATENPRERMVVALGLYLFLRSSEMESLTLQDINLEDGEIQVTIHKTVDADMMPISAELDYELRRYLTWYTQQLGVLHPQWHLIPYAYQKPYRDIDGKYTGEVGSEREWVFKPTTQPIRLYEIVQKALIAIGYETRADSGKSHGEGVHTLRRSGARALFDDLRQQGYDGALQRVRSMLHHSSGAMTERYLGINMERRQRNDAIKGQRMFTLEAENVVQIGGRDGGRANVGM